MLQKIEFINVEKSDHLIDFVEKRFQTLERRFSKKKTHESVKAHVRFVGSNYSPEGKLRGIEAEIILEVPRHKSVAVRKKGKNFEEAVHKALSAAETILRRDSEKKESSRKTIGKSKGKKIRELIKHQF